MASADGRRNGFGFSHPRKSDASPTCSLQELANIFLSDADARLKPHTLKQYRADIALFLIRFKKVAADRVDPSEVSRWLHSMKVSETTKSIRLRSVSAWFGWLVKCEFLADNPIRRVTKPRTRSRGQETVVSADVHGKLIAKASPSFRHALAVLHGTGCQPGEVGTITAANFDPVNSIIRLEVHKNDHHGRARLIFVPPEVAGRLKELALCYPTGPLIRTGEGNAWTGRSITENMQKLKKSAGIKAFPMRR